MIKNLIEFIKTVLFIAVAAFVIRQFIVQTFVVEGRSMEPTFDDGEYVLVDKLTTWYSSPKRGDVVVLRTPQDPRTFFIKRIVGLPREKVTIQNAQVKINDRVISENYFLGNSSTKINGSASQSLEVQLTNDQYFVLGDNRDNSQDSRSIGPIPGSNIVGRVFLVIFPLNKLGLINNHPLTDQPFR